MSPFGPQGHSGPTAHKIPQAQHTERERKVESGNRGDTKTGFYVALFPGCAKEQLFYSSEVAYEFTACLQKAL